MGRKKKDLITTGIKTGIYIRVSTEEQKKKGFSPDGQAKTCRDVIKSKGLTEIGVYSDVPCSGITPYEGRDAMKMLINDVRNKKINVIVFQMFDRLARDMTVAYAMIAIFKQYNIRLIECQYGVDSLEKDFYMWMNMKLSYAEMEYGMIRQRSINGTDAKKRRLGWIGGRVPFGYQKPDKNKDSIPIINDEQVEVIRLIYKLYWHHRQNLVSICKYLEENNHKPGKYSKSWKPKAIARILSDHKHKYDGEIINDNMNNIYWGKILDTEYPTYPRKSTV